MARKVFFSFHYKRDAWRAAQVRNCNKLAKEDQSGFIDAVDWEQIEKQGDKAIENWINDQLQGTTVTVVLIGAETSERDWVDFEIRKSWERGNALLGIRIHNVKDQDSKTDVAGANPLAAVKLSDGTSLETIFKTYDWVNDNGRENLGDWVEEAFTIRDQYDGDLDLAGEEDNEHDEHSRKVEHRPPPVVIRNPAGPWAK